MTSCLPTDPGEQKTYRVVYAVHEILRPTSGSTSFEAQSIQSKDKETNFVGLITLVSLDARSLALPEDLTVPVAAAATTLTVELAYSFLPVAWGRGYATEAIKAIFESCRETPSFWSPFLKLYVRAIVNEANPASQRVMKKTGMTKRGVYNWTGKAVYLAGEWRQRDTLHIYGMYLIG